MRYLGSTLRGCLLEAMAWLRSNDEADQRIRDVIADDGGHDPVEERAQAVADYLATRRVAACTLLGPGFVDIHAPGTLSLLDTDLNVHPLLDSPRGREVFGERGSTSRPHLDQAAIFLASEFGRKVTQHCSLAIWDGGGALSGVAYRSRHDLIEWCWAAYDHAEVRFGGIEPLSPDVPGHQQAVSSVAQLWSLPTHRWS